MRFSLYSQYGYAHLKKLEREHDVQGLIEALDAPRIQQSAQRRAAVVTSLKRLRSVEAAPTLSELLSSDPDEVVRRMSAIALGQLGDPAGAAPLRAALEDPSNRVQMWAIRSLGQLRDRDSVEILIDRLEAPDWGTRSYAAAALGEIGDLRAVEPLRMMLEDRRRTVRLSATHALEELGEPPNASLTGG